MPIATSGGINTYLTVNGADTTSFINGIAEVLLQAGWDLDERIHSTLNHTFNSNPTNGTTIVIDGFVYTWRNTINNAAAGQVKIESTKEASLLNLCDALFLNQATIGVAFSSATRFNFRVRGAALSSGSNVLVLRGTNGGPDYNGIVTGYGTLYGGGFKLVASSPQDLSVNMLVYDDNTTDSFNTKFVCFQMVSVSDSSVKTRVRKVRCVTASVSTSTDTSSLLIGDSMTVSDQIGVNAPLNGVWTFAGHDSHGLPIIIRKYKCNANRCQFFCFSENVGSDRFGSVMCGGIPFMPQKGDADMLPACHGEQLGDPVSECFWLSNDEGLSAMCTPRTTVVRAGHVNDANPDTQGTGNLSDVVRWDSSDAVLNGTMILGGTLGSGNDVGQFGLVSMTPTNDFDFIISSTGPHALVSSVKWWGEKPFELEPLIAFSQTDTGSSPRIIGQLWDSFIRTKQEVGDNLEEETDHTRYVAITRSSKFGTLWVLAGTTTPLQANYAH